MAVGQDERTTGFGLFEWGMIVGILLIDEVPINILHQFNILVEGGETASLDILVILFTRCSQIRLDISLV